MVTALEIDSRATILHSPTLAIQQEAIGEYLFSKLTPFYPIKEAVTITATILSSNPSAESATLFLNEEFFWESVVGNALATLNISITLHRFSTAHLEYVPFHAILHKHYIALITIGFVNSLRSSTNHIR